MVGLNIGVSPVFQGQSAEFPNESTLVIFTRVRLHSSAPLIIKGLHRCAGKLSVPQPHFSIILAFKFWFLKSPIPILASRARDDVPSALACRLAYFPKQS